MAEKSVIYEVTDFSVVDSIVSLLASYYIFHVNYPKSIPASFLYFIQEYLLGVIDPAIKKPARYKAFVNSLRKSDPGETEKSREPE